jgi:glycosyltransferase involved in cell wall biosynthesis
MKSPCHVLSVFPGFGLGGDENRLASIIRSLNPEKFRFSLLVLPTPVNFEQQWGALRPDWENNSISIHQLTEPSSPAWLPHKIRAMVRMLMKIWVVARFARERNVDLIDARLDGGILIGVLAATLARTPSVLTLYHVCPSFRYPLWQVFRAITLNLASAVITDSEARRSELRQWIWKPSGKAWSIPNGIPAPRPSRPAKDLRLELNLPADNGLKIISQISGIVPSKGHMVLLDAARRVLENYPNAFFLLVGFCRNHRAYPDQLLEKARQLGIGDRVRICSYPGPIGDIWQIVDIHVHASLFDSLPNAILEGMALGKPAVVTEVGGVREAVEHEETGLVVPPNDSEALAHALLRLLNDPNEAATLGAAARARYEVRYRPELMAQSLEHCFSSVLGNRLTEVSS